MSKRLGMYACAAGLVATLVMDWLGRTVPESSTEVRWKPIDLLHRIQLAPDVYLDVRLAIVAFGIALIVVVLVPPHQLAALLAALAGTLATLFVLLSTPDDLPVTVRGRSGVVEYGWQSAPYLALVLWLVALGITAWTWWRRRLEDYAGAA